MSPVDVLVIILFAVFLLAVREAILFYRWRAHLMRIRSDYRSQTGLKSDT